ncbi:CD109 antigen-like isoform X2 [Rhodnius prolixus]
MLWLWILEFLVYCICLGSQLFVHGSGFYCIVAPKMLRANSEYTAAVSLADVSQPTTVVVQLIGRKDSGGDYSNSEYVVVEPYLTKTVRLKVGDLGPGYYNFSVKGEGGLSFSNTTKLIYSEKSYSVFIQTDKAVYKPGHMVLFRVLVLSAHLKPVETRTIDVHITDGKNNRIKQWINAEPNRGVFSGELELSKNPILGDWKIVATVGGQIYAKVFSVAEYVLPKFEVTVNIPKHITFKDSKFGATVRAKYTYGRPVKGEATISVAPSYVSDILQPIFMQPVIKTIPIDGKAVVEFDIVKEIKLNQDFERLIVFDVTVKEELTGRKQNTTAEMWVHKHKYKMDLIKTSQYFKPGLKFTAYIKLAHYDGTPVSDQTNPLKVKSGYSYESSEYIESHYKIPPTGVVELTFYPPKNISVLGIEAEYLDIKEWFSTVNAAVSPSDTFIQAIIKTKKPKVNNDVVLVVNSTEPLRYVTYLVLGRGDVVTANSVRVPEGAKTVEWRFLATYNMAPIAHIIIQYVKADGEVIADSLDIQLEGTLQNYVRLDSTLEESEPGGNIQLNIETKPNSYVGVLGIDQSVQLLKTGNDIDEEEVVRELSSYETSDFGIFRPFKKVLDDLGQRRSVYWSPGSFTADEVFSGSGAVILTNGYVHKHTPWLYFRGGMPQDDLMFSANVSPEMAFDGGASSGLAAVKVRSDFPETWLWEALDTGVDGKARLNKQVPDSITSWIISAFSLDPVYGLGLMDVPKKVKVFRQFFISLDLPYSVIRGETMTIPVVVFNYMDKSVYADVTLENTGQFEFADYSNDVNEAPKLELYRRKKLTIQPNSGSSTSFMITPKELGFIDIKVVAKSTLAGDIVERKLLVKAEGKTVYKNAALFIDLRNSNHFKTNFTLDIPKYIVAGSEQIEIATVGDILGPSISNLAHLIKMPFGCGEQNMLNFVPNIVILDYLKNSYKLTKAVEERCLNYLEKGYQQELTYKHDNGSFSAFGNSDTSGSTWLTAFVAKSFYYAGRHSDIVDPQVISDALSWLASKQANNGSWSEVGQVSHKEMQGGAAEGLALTAYTLTAFLETRTLIGRYNNVINKAVDYLDRNVRLINDTYPLAVTAYALTLARHPTSSIAFDKLESLANTSSDMKWWTRSLSVSERKNPHMFSPNSIDVEMTAYAMLGYLERSLVNECLPIVRWLISQQNEDGGFASTQDTVVALGALAKFAAKIIVPNTDIAVSFTYGKDVTKEFKINSANSIILQKQEIPKQIREVNITARGSGFAVAMVAYSYNVNVTGAWPLFTLDPQVDKNSDHNHLQLSICSAYVGGNESNMAVMEVSLPSGYVVDQDSLPSLEISQDVKRVETKDRDTVVVLYFDKMTAKEYCPTISAFRTHKVAMQRPVPVTVYDYYDQSRQARVFYTPSVTSVCNICENEDCRICTDGKLNSQGADGPGVASSFKQSSACIILLLLSIWMR